MTVSRGISPDRIRSEIFPRSAIIITFLSASCRASACPRCPSGAYGRHRCTAGRGKASDRFSFRLRGTADVSAPPSFLLPAEQPGDRSFGERMHVVFRIDSAHSADGVFLLLDELRLTFAVHHVDIAFLCHAAPY